MYLNRFYIPNSENDKVSARENAFREYREKIYERYQKRVRKIVISSLSRIYSEHHPCDCPSPKSLVSSNSQKRSSSSTAHRSKGQRGASCGGSRGSGGTTSIAKTAATRSRTASSGWSGGFPSNDDTVMHLERTHNASMSHSRRSSAHHQQRVRLDEEVCMYSLLPPEFYLVTLLVLFKSAFINEKGFSVFFGMSMNGTWIYEYMTLRGLVVRPCVPVHALMKSS